eukprot:905225-Prorocentrum_minimum.AAC.3
MCVEQGGVGGEELNSPAAVEWLNKGLMSAWSPTGGRLMGNSLFATSKKLPLGGVPEVRPYGPYALDASV